MMIQQSFSGFEEEAGKINTVLGLMSMTKSDEKPPR